MTRPTIAATLGKASAMATAALAVASILIRVGLVPSWRRGQPADFKTWFTANERKLRAVMAPLGVAAASTTTANAVLRRRARPISGALAAVGLAGVTMTVNEPLNARFLGPDPVDPADLDR